MTTALKLDTLDSSHPIQVSNTVLNSLLVTEVAYYQIIWVLGKRIIDLLCSKNY